jgi:hypothetical protein
MGKKKCFDLKTLDLQIYVWNVTHFQVGTYHIWLYYLFTENTTQYNVTIKVSSWALQASQMRPLCCLAASGIKGQDMQGHTPEELIPQL